MGMATSKVRLNICGSSYVVNTSESEDYMQNLADRLNLDMNELMASSNSVSITTAAVMTALNYRDELEKASGSADNMRRQIKDYLEDAASAKMAAEEARRENVSLKRRIDELERRVKELEKELEKAKNGLRITEGKLANEKFVAHAPENVVNAEREKVAKYQELIAKLEESAKAMA